MRLSVREKVEIWIDGNEIFAIFANSNLFLGYGKYTFDTFEWIGCRQNGV